MGNSKIQVPFDIVTGIASDIKSISTISLAEDVPITFSSGSLIEVDLFANSRGYFQKILYQINTSYNNLCFDACALLIRKLVELIIEEIYEANGRVDEIVFPENKQLYGLNQLISTLESDSNWKLNRSVSKGLNLIKVLGDKSAHNRRYNARKTDIDKIQPYLRDIMEELLYLANIIK